MELILLILIGLITLFMVFINPYIGLLLFTTTIFLQPHTYFPGSDTLHIPRFIAIITFVFMIIKDPSALDLKNSRIKIISFLTLAYVFSFITSIWRSNSLDFFLNYLKLVIVLLLITGLCKSLKQLHLLIKAIIFLSIYLALQSMYSYIRGDNLILDYRIGSISPNSIMADPNDFALGLLVLVPFTTYFSFTSHSLVRKLVWGFCSLLFILTIFLTGSRGGTLGLLIVASFLLIKSRKKMIVVIGIIATLFIFFNFAPQQYKLRLHSIINDTSTDGNIQTRFDAWKAGINMMMRRPFGVGIGNFGEAFVTYRPDGALDVPGMRRSAHNTFIQVGGETGILGLLVFIWLIFSTLTNLKRLKSIIKINAKYANELVALSDATYISLIGFIVSGFFLSQAYGWHLYYMLGISMSLERLVRNSLTNKSIP